MRRTTWGVLALGLGLGVALPPGATRAHAESIPMATGERPDVNVDVAHDPERDQYLLVWERDGAIWGKILDGWGGTVRESFVVMGHAPTGGVRYSDPAVTFKSPENVYFVVAVRHGAGSPLPLDNIDLFRLDADGSRLSARFLASGAAGALRVPDVQADTFGSDCCVLAVWETQNGSLVGQRLDGAGELHGSALRIFDEMSPRFAHHPRVVYQRPTDVFVVAYDRRDTALASSVALRSMGAFGGSPSAEVTVAALGTRPPRPGQPQGHPDLAYNVHGRESGQDRFLVVWRDGSRVHRRRLSGARAPLGAAAPLCTAAGCAGPDLDRPAVGAETETDQFVVLYTRARADGLSAVRGSVVNGWTDAVTDVFRLTDYTARPAGNAAVWWDAGHAQFLAVWEEDWGYPTDEDLWGGFLTWP